MLGAGSAGSGMATACWRRRTGCSVSVGKGAGGKACPMGRECTPPELGTPLPESGANPDWCEIVKYIYCFEESSLIAAAAVVVDIGRGCC